MPAGSRNLLNEVRTGGVSAQSCQEIETGRLYSNTWSQRVQTEWLPGGCSGRPRRSVRPRTGTGPETRLPGRPHAPAARAPHAPHTCRTSFVSRTYTFLRRPRACMARCPTPPGPRPFPRPQARPCRPPQRPRRPRHPPPRPPPPRPRRPRCPLPCSPSVSSWRARCCRPRAPP